MSLPREPSCQEAERSVRETLGAACNESVCGVLSLATTFSNLFGAMAGVPGFLIRDAEKQLLTEHFQKIDEAQTQNDIDLALASAYAVAKQTAGATELKGRLPDKGKQKFPAVAGNELQAGTGKENATWKVDMDPKTRRPKPWQEQ